MSAAAPFAGRRMHFVGIGGAGMSGYARVCRQLGATVSGSDRSPSSALDRLRAQDITVHVGHSAANVPPGAEVYYSSAVPPDNPERIAQARPRADLLHELSGLRRTIAVAGAHGKTTTASMIAHALIGSGLDPGYLIGGELRTTGEHADWGTGEWLVVEADESDRSMLALQVEIAVVLNVELDHHATYASLAELEAVFEEFTAVAGSVIRDWPAPQDLVLEPGGSHFRWRGHDVRLAVPGEHNASNAAAALEAARLAGAAEEAAAATLATFAGAGRRFETLGRTAAGAIVVDDYAHHPTEVAATIAAARTLGPGRVIAVFQPHLFSRTRELHEQFGAALAAADLSVVVDVYPAREDARDFPGVDAGLIAADHHAGGFEAAEALVRAEAQAGDLVLVMGAGDVDELGRRLAQE